METKEKTINLTVPIIFVLAVVASFLLGLSWQTLKGEKGSSTAKIKVEKAAEAEDEQKAVLGETTIGRFTKTGDELCQQDGKPIVYFFGASSCPHCRWEHPIIKKVADKFGDQISFRNNMDNQAEDRDIWEKYAAVHRGGVPFLVLGCQYVRVGSGENDGEAKEAENLTALICKLTDSQPASVCDPVEELTGQL